MATDNPDLGERPMFVSRYLRISLLAGFSLALSLALLPADKSDAQSNAAPSINVKV